MMPFDTKQMEENKMAAQANLTAARQEIDAYRVDLEKKFGIPIDVKPSPRLLGVGATTCSLWRQTHPIDCHSIFVEPCNSGQAPYILSQSLMQIELECLAHEAGLWRCALTARAAGENIVNELFEPLISKHADPARRELMRNRAARLTRLFSSQVRALPLLMIVERRLHDRFPILRPAQFVNLNISTGLRRDELNGLEAPPQLLDALRGIKAGWDCFIDDVLHTRNFEFHRGKPHGSSGEKLFREAHPHLATSAPDAYLTLADRFAELLGFQELFVWDARPAREIVTELGASLN